MNQDGLSDHPGVEASDDASGWLAEGLAAHIGRWAMARGADAASARWATRAARELSLAIANGHVCLRLADLQARQGAWAEASNVADTAISTKQAANTAQAAHGDEVWEQPPDPAMLRQHLMASGVVGTPEAAGGMPMILDSEGRLYLHRHFDYERRLARRLVQAAAAAPAPIDAAAQTSLRQHFGAGAPGAAADWQMVAAALAMRQRLLVISGGPGTGKTSTVVKLLACLLDRQPELRIALAAPTGKAAARLGEALRQHAGSLPPGLRERLPRQAATVHRLLGAHPGGFTHDAGHPLAVDVLIVDEASMLDLALATRLLEAVPATARVVLLGDKDQLAAVEAGAVFAELSADPSLSTPCVDTLTALCRLPPAALAPPTPVDSSPLRDAVVWFTRNYRFANDSGIARAAADIRRGRAEALLQWLGNGADDAVRWIDDGGAAPGEATLQCLRDGYRPYFEALQRDPGDVAAVVGAFERFRVLCALRQGQRGVQAINDWLTREARATLGWHGAASARSAWYAGRPVMVQRNDPLMQLFNGDIGIALPGADGELRVCFADAAGGHRSVPPVRLPPHETAFAMTVHKAQGSEFDRLLVLLPAQHSRVLTRELLYTALTRARRQAVLVGSAALLAAAVASPTRRHAGLLARLRDAASVPPLAS